MINIWAIDKATPIKLLLLELIHRYGEHALTLNTQEQHVQAVEIATPNDPKLAAYIYCFAQAPGRYGIDLKFPITLHNIIGENENLTLDQVIEIIAIHLFS
ncbi:MAG: hypothetical protein QX195_10010 [Methylococcaceae bacterium]|jgi:hypothetical protein